MKLGFFDSFRLKKRAEKNVESGRTLLARWWSDKYNLPVNHALFLQRTEASITIEWYEDMYARRSEIKARLSSHDPKLSSDQRVTLMDQLAAIDRVLNSRADVDIDTPFVTGDPLVDKWEQELAAGHLPDLTEGLKR